MNIRTQLVTASQFENDPVTHSISCRNNQSAVYTHKYVYALILCNEIDLLFSRIYF